MKQIKNFSIVLATPHSIYVYVFSFINLALDREKCPVHNFHTHGVCLNKNEIAYGNLLRTNRSPDKFWVSIWKFKVLAHKIDWINSTIYV